MRIGTAKITYTDQQGGILGRWTCEPPSPPRTSPHPPPPPHQHFFETGGSSIWKDIMGETLSSVSYILVHLNLISVKRKTSPSSASSPKNICCIRSNNSLWEVIFSKSPWDLENGGFWSRKGYFCKTLPSTLTGYPQKCMDLLSKNSRRVIFLGHTVFSNLQKGRLHYIHPLVVGLRHH